MTIHLRVALWVISVLKIMYTHVMYTLMCSPASLECFSSLSTQTLLAPGSKDWEYTLCSIEWDLSNTLGEPILLRIKFFYCQYNPLNPIGWNLHQLSILSVSFITKKVIKGKKNSFSAWNLFLGRPLTQTVRALKWSNTVSGQQKFSVIKHGKIIYHEQTTPYISFSKQRQRHSTISSINFS